VAIYARYAREALAWPAVRSLPVEYPAFSLLAFLPPALVPLPYAVGFGLLAAGGTVVLVLSSDGLPRHPGWGSRVCAYLLAGTSAVLLARYDVFPALCAFGGLEAARRQRWGRAWAWAVAGGLLKLFPFLLLPGFLIAERSSSGRWPLRRLWALAPLAALAAAQQLLAPGSLLAPLRYELDRGFELSSLPGSLTMLSDPLHVRWATAFGSVEVLGQGAPVISALAGVAAVAGLLVVWGLLRQGALSVEAASLAVLSVVVLTDKAFAPQYLIWLVPFWAYWPLRRGWVASAALTTLVFPVLYSEPGLLGPGLYGATAVAALRNVVLLVATARWFAGELRAPVTERTQAPWLASERSLTASERSLTAAGAVQSCEGAGAVTKLALRTLGPAQGQVAAVSEQSQALPLGASGPKGG